MVGGIPVPLIDSEIKGGVYVYGGAVDIQDTIVLKGRECLLPRERKGQFRAR
jgi:hypothetical protein